MSVHHLTIYSDGRITVTEAQRRACQLNEHLLILLYVTIKLIWNQIKRFGENQIITDLCYQMSVLRGSPSSRSRLWVTKHWKKYLQGRSAPGSIRVSTQDTGKIPLRFPILPSYQFSSTRRVKTTSSPEKSVSLESVTRIHTSLTGSTGFFVVYIQVHDVEELRNTCLYEHRSITTIFGYQQNTRLHVKYLMQYFSI